MTSCSGLASANTPRSLKSAMPNARALKGRFPKAHVPVVCGGSGISDKSKSVCRHDEASGHELGALCRLDQRDTVSGDSHLALRSTGQRRNLTSPTVSFSAELPLPKA